MWTKEEVQGRINALEAEEKQMFANLNYLLGQKSVLATLLEVLTTSKKEELDDVPIPVMCDNVIDLATYVEEHKEV